jgi:hypothetical protein
MQRLGDTPKIRALLEHTRDCSVVGILLNAVASGRAPEGDHVELLSVSLDEEIEGPQSVRGETGPVGDTLEGGELHLREDDATRRKSGRSGRDDNRAEQS